jgi:hypothetical protein
MPAPFPVLDVGAYTLATVGFLALDQQTFSTKRTTKW